MAHKLTRVVPRPGHVMCTPPKDFFFSVHTTIAPHQQSLPLSYLEQGIAHSAASARLESHPNPTHRPRFRHFLFHNHTQFPNTQDTMSFDWTHQFCLACDKQTDGATYCSESCRLADFEKTSSTPSSGSSSPAFSSPAHDWAFSKPTTTNPKFYLSPAYDFSSPARSARHAVSSPVAAQQQTISPSSSHTSLCSMKSTSSAGLDSAQLSERAARELRAYARSFESVRLQRRRSH
ncbi:hypothetical protein V8F06_013773 [Rhypophila decipiens]